LLAVRCSFSFNVSHSEYNWDPATFAFTVAIGILAFIVAITTVFQGALAAGPGRIKASRRAIGGFSQYSRSRFDWTELRVRTTAIVPSIHINGKAMSELRIQPKNAAEKLKNYAATWANFLARISNSTETFPRETLVCETDYVPSDIPAAPATGDIESIITLAALFGCDEVIIENGWPIAGGNNLQVSFRDHPLLGKVAMSQDFPMLDTYRSDL
jgi:hypothetical protein